MIKIECKAKAPSESTRFIH